MVGLFAVLEGVPTPRELEAAMDAAAGFDDDLPAMTVLVHLLSLLGISIGTAYRNGCAGPTW